MIHDASVWHYQDIGVHHRKEKSVRKHSVLRIKLLHHVGSARHWCFRIMRVGNVAIMQAAPRFV